MMKNSDATPQKKASTNGAKSRSRHDFTRKPSETPRAPREVPNAPPREIPRQSLPSERDRERAENEGMIAQNPEHGQDKGPVQAGMDDGVEGEGSYSATHRYNEALRRSIERCDVDELGDEAALAIDGPEGESLREAEEAAKQGKTAPKRSA